MNYNKLAYQNIKKCFKDYVVYFLTLVFGVAIFYVFNSIGDQSVVEEMSESAKETIQLILTLLQGASVGVAFVLGFLILYANRFLIKRRKKEFGVYLLLGMGKREVSRILIVETVFVGLVSLGAGLLLGIIGSQMLSILIGKMFDGDLSAYAFRISVSGVKVTLGNYLVMYLVVILFHTITISKCKLIDLLSAHKTVEKQHVKNTAFSGFVFGIAVVALVLAYIRVGFMAEEITRGELFTWIMVGIVATLLFFWSLSGFILGVAQKNPGFYYRNLNVFVLRQFGKSIQSSSVIMGITCILLFFTMTTFTTGFSMAHVFQENVRSKTPVDFCVMSQGEQTPISYFETIGFPVSEWMEKDFVSFPIYGSNDFTYSELFGPKTGQLREQFPRAIFFEQKVFLVRQSDYNAMAKLYGKKQLTLSDKQYRIICDYQSFVEVYEKNLASSKMLSILGTELEASEETCEDMYLEMSGVNDNVGYLVLPDEWFEVQSEKLEISKHFLAGNYVVFGKDHKKEIDRWLTKQVFPEGMVYETKNEIREANNGLTILITFLVIYVGVAFLLASAAIFSLKALSDAMDSTERYEILMKLGCEEKQLRRTAFWQVGVYFIAPLALALVHTVFGVRYLKSGLQYMMQIGLSTGILFTVLLLGGMYSAYLLATYGSSKRIMKI